MSFPKKNNWTLIGEVGVDAGLLWLGDPCYILHKKEGETVPQIGNSWAEFCDKLDEKSEYWQFGYGDPTEGNPRGEGNGLGVCVHTGYGDGSYPVYAQFRNKRLVRVYVDFDVEDEDEDEDEEDE